MFAAAAIVARWVWDAAVIVAKWLALKVFMLACLAVVLPWVLRGFFVWGFDWLTNYGSEILGFFTTAMQEQIAAAGMDASINLELTGIGGYFALKTGLIDYIAIISTGWGLYWMVAFLSKATRIR